MAKDFHEQMAAAAERAVDMARARGGPLLDYSEASLGTVEAMLGEIESHCLFPPCRCDVGCVRDRHANLAALRRGPRSLIMELIQTLRGESLGALNIASA